MDISVFIDKGRFNYRVGAFITCGDYVLLQKSENCEFWNMLGGRAHIGESSKQALIREMKEELGIEIDNMTLVHLAENFFPWEGIDVHEILMVYKVELPEEYLTKLENFAVIDGHGEVAKWFKKSKVKDLYCLPKLIYDLAKNDNRFKHTIVEE